MFTLLFLRILYIVKKDTTQRICAPNTLNNLQKIKTYIL
jgi:hypothetical protein